MWENSTKIYYFKDMFRGARQSISTDSQAGVYGIHDVLFGQCCLTHSIRSIRPIAHFLTELSVMDPFITRRVPQQ